MDRQAFVENPYRPGAGHFPPYFAGRSDEQTNFRRMLRDNHPTDNFLITGLRGFGKTVLLDCLRRMSEEHSWLWVGNDLSESSSLSEERLAIRILTDLSATITEKLTQNGNSVRPTSLASRMATAEDFGREKEAFEALKGVYEHSPGLPSDKLKAVMHRAASLAARTRSKGIVLAYDEAQCMSDHAERNEFPMSMLVETIGALQRRNAVVPIVLVLSGLPHVQDALTETRTYTERMFHVMHLDRLSRDDTWAALANPLQNLMPPLRASKELIDKVADLSGGYPYLIQFFGKELVEKLLDNGGTLDIRSFPPPETLERLDAGLFGARWNKTTEKQRQVLEILASRGIDYAPDFSAADVVGLSKDKGDLNGQQASQMLHALCDRGLLYRTRHGRYAFTVPMSEEMILRRMRSEQEISESWEQNTAPSKPPSTPSKSKGWRWFR